MIEEEFELSSKGDKNLEGQKGRETSVWGSREAAVGLGLFVGEEQKDLGGRRGQRKRTGKAGWQRSVEVSARPVPAPCAQPRLHVAITCRAFTK